MQKHGVNLHRSSVLMVWFVLTSISVCTTPPSDIYVQTFLKCCRPSNIVVIFAIVTKEGSQLAKEQGVLKRGIPAVQLVAGSHSNILMAGKLEELGALRAAIQNDVKRYRATINPVTKLLVHSEFYFETSEEL